MIPLRKLGSVEAGFAVDAGGGIGGCFTTPPSFTGGGDTRADGLTEGAVTTLAMADGVGGAVSRADTEAVGATLAMAVADGGGAESAGSTPLLERITPTIRLASATPATDPATNSVARRRLGGTATGWSALDSSTPLCCINGAVEEISESPFNDGGGGGAGGGPSGGVPAPDFPGPFPA